MTKQDILIIHGTDYKEMAKQILTQADVAALIGDRDKQVALKPNLASANAPSTGATTHPQLLAGTIEYLQEHGFHPVSYTHLQRHQRRGSRYAPGAGIRLSGQRR